MTQFYNSFRSLAAVLSVFAVFGLAVPLSANPLAPGWKLNPEMSNIRFQSVKNETKVESSSFATFSGVIAETGDVSVTVALDSVDTKIDLRNVRMRFLFFETFKYPEATVTAQVTADMLDGIAERRRKTVTVPIALSLHGITQEFTAEMVITALTDDLVSVASGAPLSIPVAPFGLEPNIKKLEEAAGGISIIPSATVTFDLVFARNAVAKPSLVVTSTASTAGAAAALETQGDFSREQCVGRFEILSRTGNIYFRTASARLDAESTPLLESVVDIVQRCPDLRLEVAGHTDSDGGEAANQTLSERRAASVVSFLVEKGIDRNRLQPVGYGELRPFVDNSSASNKARNRRIEFVSIN